MFMQEYGDIRTFYTALSQQWVLVGYYDLFAAKLAKNSLNGQVLYGARVEASFSAWKEAREHNEGQPSPAASKDHLCPQISGMSLQSQPQQCLCDSLDGSLMAGLACRNAHDDKSQPQSNK